MCGQYEGAAGHRFLYLQTEIEGLAVHLPALRHVCRAVTRLQTSWCMCDPTCGASAALDSGYLVGICRRGWPIDPRPRGAY